MKNKQSKSELKQEVSFMLNLLENKSLKTNTKESIKGDVSATYKTASEAGCVETCSLIIEAGFAPMDDFYCFDNISKIDNTELSQSLIALISNKDITALKKAIEIVDDLLPIATKNNAFNTVKILLNLLEELLPSLTLPKGCSIHIRKSLRISFDDILPKMSKELLEFNEKHRKTYNFSFYESAEWIMSVAYLGSVALFDELFDLYMKSAGGASASIPDNIIDVAICSDNGLDLAKKTLAFNRSREGVYSLKWNVTNPGILRAIEKSDETAFLFAYNNTILEDKNLEAMLSKSMSCQSTFFIDLINSGVIEIPRSLYRKNLNEIQSSFIGSSYSYLKSFLALKDIAKYTYRIDDIIYRIIIQDSMPSFKLMVEEEGFVPSIKTIKLAIAFSSLDILLFLLSNECLADKTRKLLRKKGLLYTAINNNKIDFANYLVDHSFQKKDGKSLRIAISRGYLELSQKLLKRGFWIGRKWFK